MRLEQLREKKQALSIEAAALLALDDDQMSDDDLARADTLKADAEKLDKQIRVYEDLGQLVDAGPLPRQKSPAAVQSSSVAGSILPGGAYSGIDGKWGYRNGAEFLTDVVRASLHGPAGTKLVGDAYRTGLREFNNAVLERSGQEGGHAIPPDFAPDIKILHEGDDSLLSLTDATPTASNHVWTPIEEGVPHDFSGGVRAYWAKEATAVQKTSPVVDGRLMELNKLMVRVDQSNEAMDDQPALERLLRVKMPQAVVAKSNKSVMRGNGQGEMLGVLNSASRVIVPRESGQSATTITSINTFKMFARFDMSLLRNARWMINQDALPQFLAMTINVRNQADTDNVGGSAVFVPGGNIAGAPFGTLLGIPIMITEWCRPLGTEGDIALVGWSMYRSATKTTQRGIEFSGHILFDQDAQAFRLVFRVLGHPWWAKPKPRADSSNTNTLGMIVTLGAPP